ncbi:replication-associated recombination protein A [Candidatus Margulisiibacteriota bacterium]
MQSLGLFPEETNDPAKDTSAPLAYQMAPMDFEEFVGQEHILGKDKPLRSLIEQDKLISLILWGPPGCGKTSLSRLISRLTKSEYSGINAVTAKVADLKQAIEQAKVTKQKGQKTILFIDEIHRFNKLQQDALLPEVENGLITMIGATTENPFFSVIPGLISRSQVFELYPLERADLEKILGSTLSKLNSIKNYSLDNQAKEFLVNEARGDARRLINMIEAGFNLVSHDNHMITRDRLELLAQTKGTVYNEDSHYDLISAFIKSMRGSDPDAAIYWLARMLKGGEDPEFIARRMIIFASEDIGNADPQALVLATSLLEAVRFIGMPEIQINLAHVTTYLATAPKSNASYMAIKKANLLIDEGVIYNVPKHLRSSTYQGKKQLGLGKGYVYSHDYPDAEQQFLPKKHTFYH